MSNFDRKTWHARKQAQRIKRYRLRMEQQRREVDTRQWLAAVRRDDACDRDEPRDRAPEHQQSSQEAH